MASHTLGLRLLPLESLVLVALPCKTLVNRLQCVLELKFSFVSTCLNSLDVSDLLDGSGGWPLYGGGNARKPYKNTRANAVLVITSRLQQLHVQIQMQHKSQVSR